MLFKDEHTFSFIPKCFFIFSIITASFLAGYLMFTNVKDMISLLKPYAVNGNFTRQIIIMSCLIFYIFRLFITAFVFLKRKMGWGETIIVSGLMSFALFSFARIGGSSQSAINSMDYFGIMFFLAGSWINTHSEYLRHIWKKYKENRGKLYTGGLFKYSMHINYFGDVLLFCGLG